MGAKRVILVLIYCGFIFTMFQVASVSSTEDLDHNVRVMKVDVVKRNTSEELRLGSVAAGRKLLGLDALGKAIAQSLKKFKGFKNGDDAAKSATNNKDEKYFEKMIEKKCTKPNYPSCCMSETMGGNVTCSRYCCFDKLGKKLSNVLEFTNGGDDTGSGLKNIASVYVLSSISLCYFIYYVLLLS